VRHSVRDFFNRTTTPVTKRQEFPVRKFHSPIANLFRCYFAILTTGADAVLVADAARPCVVQP
jgi:2-C-methyl-D-erythritol 4-phosphate cytidylyltransferase